jgi:hypothetical protein
LHCGTLGSAPAAFTGDQLVAIVDSADDERLNDSARGDGAGKFVERVFAEARARLIGTGIDQVDIDLKKPITLSCRWSRPLARR